MTRDETMEALIQRLRAEGKWKDLIWICTLFDDEPEPKQQGYHWGLEGVASTHLGTLTDHIWAEYACRQGHAHAWQKKPELGNVAGFLPGQNAWRYEVEPAWQAYRVYLRDDATNTPLDISKTLGELGLTERRYWVRFERAL